MIFVQTDFGDSKKLTDPEESKQIGFNQLANDDRNSLFETLEVSRAQVAGTFVGTALYMSPEMLNNNNAV